LTDLDRRKSEERVEGVKDTKRVEREQGLKEREKIDG